MNQPLSHLPYIVADIGGTNARFGLVTDKNALSGSFSIEYQCTYSSQDFSSIEQAVSCYIESLKKSLNGTPIKGACLAVAGPVAGEHIRLTNLNWEFDISTVRSRLKLPKLEIINDFAAYAYAIQYLDTARLQVINQGHSIATSPVAVVGPGTGFGVASLVRQGHRVNVISSEGGHMSLAANTPLQAAIKEQLSRKYSVVSIERVFSGPGLRHLYHALAAVEGTESEDLHTAEITERALNADDALCSRTLALFCSWLGSVTGDLTLALGAQGGVFLGGGILPRIADFLIASDFIHSFKAKDQMSHYLQDIPIHLVTEDNSALLGSAAAYENGFG